ncbi:MAG: hypothetical protein A2842_02450 [Candidatus Wildermuthbacteria bacterium RIFCSPHIGHO2_01_FULL_48_25]|nr:MAG: hypothetical protein A2842_02450 [Candidatus Wildermuthbacteria bacterium RIFCSPHIGHO2_01_FULL_48_25]
MNLYGYSPPKNPLSKKSSASEFLNLPHAREARGAPQNQWLSLAQAKTDFPKMGLISTVVTLYNQARTYFAQHPNS